jgi:aspartokinase-like uncharacterized kinase
MNASTEAPAPLRLSPVVVKVGGSLYDWAELGPRLRQFLETLRRESVVLVPGGGPFADVIRDLDRIHGLGDVAAHWLALQSQTSAAQFLAQLVPGARIIEALNPARNHWMRGRVTILNMLRFARGDESRVDHLPHTWAATSDSLAARVARIAGAARLILLKSATLPEGMDWNAAAASGYVDEFFPGAIAAAAFPVEAINLRRYNIPG